MTSQDSTDFPGFHLYGRDLQFAQNNVVVALNPFPLITRKKFIRAQTCTKLIRAETWLKNLLPYLNFVSHPAAVNKPFDAT